MISITLINTQTDRQLLTGYTISSASWAKNREIAACSNFLCFWTSYVGLSAGRSPTRSKR